MKILGVILLVLSFCSPEVKAGLCKSQRSRTHAEQIATLSPKADLDLLSLDIFPSGSLVTGYKYKVEPAFTNGLYERTDNWVLGFEAVPDGSLDLGDAAEFSFSGGIRNKNEARFIRYFNDPCKAMLSIPYTPRNIPLKAKTALSDRFKIGDYFLFRSSVGLVVSGDILALLGQTPWGFGVTGSYLMEGFYQLHIVRTDEDHIRLKILALRGKNTSGGVAFGYMNEFDVFSINSLNNQLEKIVNTRPLKITADYRRSKVFMVDYVLDLRDPAVVSAFESVIRKAGAFRNIKLTGPFWNIDLQRDILLDLSPLENLYRRDLENGEVERLKRNLQTTSEQSYFGFSVNAGNKLLGMKFEKGVSTAYMSVKQTSETDENYLLKSWSSDWEGRFLYSLGRSEKDESLNALFRADASYEHVVPVNIVQQITHKKNRFRYREFLKLKLMLKKSLPAEIYQTIPFSQWKQGEDQKYLNYGLRYQLVMTPETLLDAPELSPKEIAAFFVDHMSSKGLVPSDYILENNQDNDSLESNFDYSLNHMARLLSRALDKKRPIKERLEAVTSLRRNTLFKESGISFLMSLRPEKMKKMYHLTLNISSNEALIDYQYGDAEVSVLYKKILTIKSALDDDALDLLREAQSISFPEAG